MTKRRSEAGQALYIMVYGLFVIIAAAGLAVDMGYLRYEKRLMQSAADSAAIAAATDENHGDAGMATADALAVAEANGFTNNVNNVTVTVTNSGVTPANSVQVQVQQVLPSVFMKIFSLNTATISSTSIATIGTSNGCIYALQAGGLTVNAGINSPNCGVVDNGVLTGSGDITAESIGVYGSDAGYAGVTAPETIAQPAADPLSYLTPPTPGTCTVPMTITTTVALTEGTFCGFIINSGGTANFGPGLYILHGPTGLQINGTGIANGTDVMFYTDTGLIAFDPAGTGRITLSAPDDAEVSGDPNFGSLPAGILFYQDPTDPNTTADVSQGGSGNVTLAGTLYFPKAALTIAGSLNSSANTLVVAGSVIVSGSVLMNADSTSNSLPGGSPLRTVTLVE